MKKRVNLFGIIAIITVLLALSLTGCPDGDSVDKGPKTLSGNITISPSANVTIGTQMIAYYSRSETVSYLWKKGETNVGTNSNKYTPTEVGSYTVTVSADGYNSKTSAAVIVEAPPMPELAFKLIDGGTAYSVFRGTLIETEVIIPSVHEGLPVTVIEDRGFASYGRMTSIIIPESVTNIGNFAFSGCSGLTSVTIGNSVTSIGDHAFSDCSGLTSITIPNSVTSIGDNAFSWCSGLTNITIPNSVTSIGSDAFWNCSGLTGSLTIPNSVTSIGNAAFLGCSGLTGITIPDSVKSIGWGAFDGCSRLTVINFNATAMSDLPSSSIVFDKAGQNAAGITVNIGANVTRIPADLFNGGGTVNGKTKIIAVNFAAGSVCQSIGDTAFSYCSDLTSVTIPNSVKSIGFLAFDGCTGLTSVTIGNGVTSIGDAAFQLCSGLTSVTIPNSVTSIGRGAFLGCSGLTSVTFATGSNITNDNFGSYAFPESDGIGSVKTAYSTGKAGTYTRESYGSTWMKQP